MLLFNIRNDLGTLNLNLASENILVGGEHFYYGKVISSSDITIKCSSPFGGFAEYTFGNITFEKGTPIDNETELLITAFIYDSINDDRINIGEIIGRYSADDLDTITFTLFAADPFDDVFQKDTYYSDTLLNVCSDFALLLGKSSVQINWSCPSSIVDRQVTYYAKKGSSVLEALSVVSANSCCVSFVEGNSIVLTSIHGGERYPVKPIYRFFQINKTGLITKSITATADIPCSNALLVENGDSSTVHTDNKYTFHQSGTDFIISNIFANSLTPPAYINSYKDFLTRKHIELHVPLTESYHIGNHYFLPKDNDFSFIVVGISYKATEDACVLYGIDARRTITKVGDTYLQTPFDCPDWSNVGHTDFVSTLTAPVNNSTLSGTKKINLAWTDVGGIAVRIDVLVKTNPGKVFVTHEIVCGSLAGYDVANQTFHYTMKYAFDPGKYDFEIQLPGVGINTIRTVTFT